MFGGSFFGQTFFGGLSSTEAAIVIIIATLAIAPVIACKIQIEPLIEIADISITPALDADI